MKDLLEALKTRGIAVRENCLLSVYSSFRVGGVARAIAIPDTRERLVDALNLARASGVRFSVFGNASNVVFADEGYEGLVIFTGECKSYYLHDGSIYADAGVSLGKLSMLACERGLAGGEFLFGIPGTVGGGIFMNAGAFGGSMADICIASEFWNSETGEIGRLLGEEHRFSYRTSAYEVHPEWVILGAYFLFGAGDSAEIRAKMEDYLGRRKTTQPLEYPSAGSVFKRPEGHFAGKLIEDCGLKGYTVGGAQVSQKHAGFIVNVGGATAADIRALVLHIQRTVERETGVSLECEIRFVESGKE